MTTPPPMYAPPAPEGPKKTPIWVWILAAVGGMIVLAIIGISLAGYFLFQKAKEVATNPAAAAAIISKLDPNLEVLDVDEEKKIIRVRNKENNEEVTLNLSDILQGKMKISHEGKDGVETFELGGKVKLPRWLPAYPGAEMKSIGAGRSDKEGSGGLATFETADPPEKIISFYRGALEKESFKAEEGAQVAGASVLIMKTESGNAATITVTPNDGKSQVTVIYGNK